jgi:serine-type D-Ala-D-Ala carboxypeptidase/endopeptidase
MRILSSIALAAALLLVSAIARADDKSAIAVARSEAAAFAGTSTALSIGVVTADGTHSVHAGTLDPDKASAPDDRTLYEIGSLTKTFTSTILAHAVTEKRIALDDDIRKYLPPGFANLAWQGEPVRVVHLANLTSGLPNWLPDPSQSLRNVPPEQVPAVLVALHRGYDRARFYADLAKVALSARPGTTPRHSNVAAQLLADMLERVYDEPYAALLERYITKPLGMGETSFDAGGSRFRNGHDANGRPMPLVSDMPGLAASGGLRSSTRDMIGYLRHQLDERNDAIRLSHQPTVRTKDDEVALNWHIAQGSERSLWHTGGTFGFASYVVLYPERRLAIVLMANENDPTTQSRLAAIGGKIAAAYAAQ